LYGAAEFLRIAAVNRTSGPVSVRWTLVIVAALTLALAGCGRKGPLDLPPTAAGPAVEQGDNEERAAAKGTVFDPSYGANELPKTPKGSKERSFILDPLLDSR
jgi:predicted small lipoprotein YifL